MEFLFEEAGAALRIAQIFGYVAAGFDVKGDAAALKGSAHIQNALAMGMIEPFGNAEERGEATGHALIGVRETGVSGVVTIRLRLTIVIADNRGDNVAIASFETRDVAVQSEIFPMLMVATVADAVAEIVKQRGGFQLNPGLDGKMV